MKKKLSKAAVELSINFVVMLVLAIAVFSLGLVFITKLFNKAEDIKIRLDSQSEQELKTLLNPGKQIAVYPSRWEIRPNSYKVIGVGILNTIKETGGAKDNFRLNVRFVKAVADDNSLICEQGSEAPCSSTDVDEWLMTDMVSGDPDGVMTESSISKNSKNELLFVVQVPDDPELGRYIFAVNVSYEFPAGSWKPYASPDRFYLIVK